MSTTFLDGPTATICEMEETVIGSPFVTFSHPSEGKSFSGKAFPLLVRPSHTVSVQKLDLFTKWIEANRSEIDDLLLKHGAILFRDFPIDSAFDFDTVIKSTKLKGMKYIGGAAVRTQITETVFTANESPSSEKIPFHHEMSQVPEPPTHLFFYCEVPPGDGGETPILESSEVCRRLESLHPTFMEDLQTHGVQYVRFMSREDDPSSAIGRGWASTYSATTQAEVETALRASQSTFEWLPNGVLKTVTKVLPAIRFDGGEKRSNTKNFFNSVVAAFTGWNDNLNVGSQAVLLGNGQLIDPIVIQDAVKIMDEICVAFKWQKGDVILIDNRTVMHSRRPFEGKRKILASLVRDADR